MITSKQFVELPYQGKIDCLKEIFGQITTTSESLDNIRYYLDTDFVFQDKTLVDLFKMIEDSLKTGKSIDEVLSTLSIKQMKIDAQQSQEKDAKKADELLQNEILEQDTLREQIKNEKLTWNGKLDKKEREWLNSKDELYRKGGFDIIDKDIIDTNKRQFSNQPIVMRSLDMIQKNASEVISQGDIYLQWTKSALLQNKPLWYYNIVTKKNVPKYMSDRAESVLRRYNEGMKKAGDDVLKKRIVAANTLLALNNKSKQDISNFWFFGEQSIKALHRYQKSYQYVDKSKDRSKADCILGKRTVQQLIYNIGITSHIPTPRADAIQIDKKYDHNQEDIKTLGRKEVMDYKSSLLNSYITYLENVSKQRWDRWENEKKHIEQKITSSNAIVNDINSEYKNPSSKQINDVITHEARYTDQNKADTYIDELIGIINTLDLSSDLNKAQQRWDKIITELSKLLYKDPKTQEQSNETISIYKLKDLKNTLKSREFTIMSSISIEWTTYPIAAYDPSYSGLGCLTYSDWKKMIWNWRDGKLVGDTFFEYNYNNSWQLNKYIWSIKDDLRNWKGTHTWADGRKYVGEFKDDMINWKGTYTWANGTKYVGEFKDDLFNWKGTYTNQHGKQFTWNRVDGMYISSDGSKLSLDQLDDIK